MKGDSFMELEELKAKLLSHEITPEDASNELVKNYRGKMLYFILLGKEGKYSKFTDTDKQMMFLLIYLTQYIYNYTGLPTGLDDTEYDQLYETYLNLGMENELITVSSSNNTDFHMYPSLRGTLSKIHHLSDDEERKNKTRKFYSEWISSKERLFKEKTGNDINLREQDIYVFPKWDGVSCIFEFNPDGTLNKALTRGDVETNTAQNITDKFPSMHGKVTKNGYGLKTEIMMTEDNLEKFNKQYGFDYKQTRSVVSAILSTDINLIDDSILHIEKLRTETINHYGEENLQKLDDMCFESPYIKCKLGDIEAINNFAQSHRFVNGLRCDGAVIYIIDPEIQEVLGRENNKNNYEVAYKFTEEVMFSEIKDVVFQVGYTGILNPIAKIKPVKIKGNTIKRVSLGSMDRFASMHLHKGDRVKICYDIIPYLIYDLECGGGDGKEFKIPKKCPYCGEKLEKDEAGVPYRCVNNKCDYTKKAKIYNFIDKMDIDGIGYSTVDRLYDEGLWTNILSIYETGFMKHQIEKLSGFNEVSYNAINNAISSKKVVKDYVLLGALGIDGAGKETFKKILQEYSIKRLMIIANYNDIESLCKIAGIKEKKAEKIIKGLKNNTKLLDKLLKILTIKHDSSPEDVRYRVCFTKIRPDEEMEKFIKETGGEIVDNVTSSTTFLCTKDLDTDSSKTKKAKKLGILVVPISQFKENVNTIKEVNYVD